MSDGRARAYSIAQRTEETGGRTTGFDYLRIWLATSVILVHSTSVSYGLAADKFIWVVAPLSVYDHMILPMFFALSGFLVAGSLERCPTLVSFFGLRILRIVPPLGIEVVLSAVIFGALLSSLGLGTYFSRAEFYAYFLNIVGDIHYTLPGVFSDNPWPGTINQQLWTVPVELESYVTLGALAVVGFVKERRLIVLIVILAQCLWIWEAIRRGEGVTPGTEGPVLILCFLAGVLFARYKDRIILSKTIFLIALTASVGLLLLPHGSFLVPIPATYVTIYLGLLSPPKPRFLFSGDYSYGLYLYGFPLQQAFASLGAWSHHWYLNFPMCLSATFTVAIFSWHVIEKPSLALRRNLPWIEQGLERFFCGARSSLGLPIAFGAAPRTPERELRP